MLRGISSRSGCYAHRFDATEHLSEQAQRQVAFGALSLAFLRIHVTSRCTGDFGDGDHAEAREFFGFGQGKT